MLGLLGLSEQTALSNKQRERTNSVNERTVERTSSANKLSAWPAWPREQTAPKLAAPLLIKSKIYEMQQWKCKAF